MFRCSGLDLNFSSGKSECVLSVTGAGKKHASARNGNRSCVSRLDGGQVELLSVKSYKQIGTRTLFESEAAAMYATLDVSSVSSS